MRQLCERGLKSRIRCDFKDYNKYFAGNFRLKRDIRGKLLTFQVQIIPILPSSEEANTRGRQENEQEQLK